MSESNDRKVRSRSNLVNAASTIVVIALFAIAALVLLGTGMQVYNNVVLAANENFELRTSLSYIATKVRQFDDAGCVTVREYDGNNVLVLTENYQGDIYNTYVYYENGCLREMMQYGEFEPDFSSGFEMLEIDDFKFELENGILRMTATNSAGTSEMLELALRTD